MLEGGRMRRFAITHKGSALSDIIANSELLASSKEAEIKRREEERLLVVCLFPGTHPELTSKPHIIILRDLKKLKDTPAARKLYATYQEALKARDSAGLGRTNANIFTVGIISDYDTQEIIYDPLRRAR